MPVYFIAQVEIHDAEGYGAFPMVIATGAMWRSFDTSNSGTTLLTL